MRDLTFQEALDAPDLPFRRFVADCVELRSSAVLAYESAGSPDGPVGDGDNVLNWVLAKLDGLDAVAAAEDFLDLP
jgi:hypothetical protein